jgi:hypothetical protein
MGETAIFRSEDRYGLLAALVLHGALIAVLALQFGLGEPRRIPQRMSVSLASEVGLEATAPDPVEESRAALAPSLSDMPAPEAETAPDEPAEAEVTPPSASARESAPSRERSRTDRDRRQRETPPAAAREQAGGSRIGEDFLEGSGSSTSSEETRAPAARFGSAERAALASAITRQIRPHWTAPSGADAEKLVSIVSWQLARDGSLQGRPTCRTVPSSITDSNRPQVGLHCERAIRAVQLAAPFNLPEQFYNRWNDLEWQFDRRL